MQMGPVGLEPGHPPLRDDTCPMCVRAEKGRRAFDGYLDPMERRLEEERVAAATMPSTIRFP